MVERARSNRRLALMGLLLLAAALRLHRLGSQLWLDEIDAVLNGMRRPVTEILTVWPRTTRNPLYELLGRACLRALGESPVSVRLPAVAFGVASVWMLYRLARDRFEPKVALLAAALLAVSAPHVFYSQNARGYTALVFFSLAAAHLLLRWQRRGGFGRGEGLAYALSGTLAAYSVLFGLFVVPGQGLAGFAFARGAPPAARSSLFRASLGSLLLTGLVYAPFTGSLWALRKPPERPPLELGFLYHRGVIEEALRGLSDAFLGPVGLAVVAALALLGALRWWRRDAFSLAALSLPVLLELAAPVLGLPTSPRYFAVALPTLLLAVACGLEGMVARLISRRPGPRWQGLEAALLATAVLATALPLRAYYRVPKQDFLGARAGVERLAGQGDARVAVHFASHGLSSYYGGFEPVQSLAELLVVENRHRRVWLVTTLEPYLAEEDPGLYRRIKTAYRSVEVLPATVARAEMHLYVSLPHGESRGSW
jgi:mannosyltransferase